MHSQQGGTTRAVAEGPGLEQQRGLRRNSGSACLRLGRTKEMIDPA